MTTEETIKAWMLRITEIPERERRLEAIRNSLRDKEKNPLKLAIFGRYFFPHIIRGEMPDCHLDLIREMTKRTDSAIIFPRGHAKSTWEKIDCIHDIVYGLEPVILYVGNTITDAQFHFEAIKSELEGNLALQDVYGQMFPPGWQDSPKWTNKHFETTSKVNVVARGAGKGRGVNIKNQRPTKIVIDDAEDDELVRSPERRAKLRQWLNNVIIPSVDRERGYVKMIGTVLNDDCEVLNFYRKNGGIFRKAIENGQSIWWPMEKLDQLKAKIGSIPFAQEYMNEPTNEETALVKLAWMQFYQQGEAPANLTKYAFADLAISAGATADYFVIIVIGVDEKGGVWIVDLVREKGMTFAAQVEAVIQTHIKHKVTRFGIESVAYQRALEQEVKRRSNELGIYVPAVPVIPDTDKGRRLLRITAQIENGTIHFLREHSILTEELTRFPNAAHDDTCLVAETSVFTNFGNIPICHVRRGMEVMTRQGWKKVIAAGKTGTKRVISNIGITGTPDHPVITSNGVIDLAHVNASDTIYAWNPKSKSIEARRIGDIRTANAGNCACISGVTTRTRHHHSHCIGRSTSTISGLFRRVALFITRMATRSTTTRPISKCKRPASTRQTICPCPRTGKDQGEPSASQSTRRGRGMARKKVGHGTGNMRERFGRIRNAINKIVSSAIKNSSLFTGWRCFAATTAANETGERDVYNLQVEDAHEFFANGILVHNCDTLTGVMQMIGQGVRANIHFLEDGFDEDSDVYNF